VENITFKHFKAFSEAPLDTQKVALKSLGYRQSSFRSALAEYDVECVFAYAGDTPIAVCGYFAKNKAKRIRQSSVELYVKQRYRRKGIGTRMLEMILAEKDPDVECYPHDKASLRLFKKFEGPLELMHFIGCPKE
jgi:GNAT superfamily N-acetyltransferase